MTQTFRNRKALFMGIFALAWTGGVVAMTSLAARWATAGHIAFNAALR